MREGRGGRQRGGDATGGRGRGRGNRKKSGEEDDLNRETLFGQDQIPLATSPIFIFVQNKTLCNKFGNPQISKEEY